MKIEIRETLEKIKEYVVEKHKKDTTYYENIIMTKQIGDIKISNEQINKPKKALIVSVSFVTAFILSIISSFFL